MTTPYYRHKDNIHYCNVTSEEEVERLHDAVVDEEVRLQRLLEYNHAMLIRSGIAQKYDDANKRTNAEHEIRYKGMGFHRFKEATPETQFQVAHYHDSLGHLDLGAVAIGMQDRMGTLIAPMGSRIFEGGQLVSVTLEPAYDFTEEDVLYAGSLLDLIHKEVEAGKLPHLSIGDVILNSLTVHSSQAVAPTT